MRGGVQDAVSKVRVAGIRKLSLCNAQLTLNSDFEKFQGQTDRCPPR